MAPDLNSTKDLFVFLGKSVFSVLEDMVFTLIPKPQKNVAGEIVLITGAGSGLGRLLALKFASLGSVLVLWDINKEGTEETCEMAQAAGATRVYAYTCDCSQREEVYRVADQTSHSWATFFVAPRIHQCSEKKGTRPASNEQPYHIGKSLHMQKGKRESDYSDVQGQVKREVGDVSILINNAGIVTGKNFLDCPDELIEKSFDVNFKAHLWTYKAFLPAMIANDHGHLVCISSSAGLTGVNGLADYCASKFAAFGFAEAVFAETVAQKQMGIKTTIVCPLLINTGMFEGCTTKFPSLLPVLEPEYAVRKIVDAILQEKVYLYIPRVLYFLVFLKSILSSKIATLLCEYLGIFNVMDGFVGKKKKD
uniref:Short chain dehydrogenase/reductase family 16C member 5 n=1 Tax=Equus caballus TaxID=9796 RepID=A0A3Q2LUC0_HORSE